MKKIIVTRRWPQQVEDELKTISNDVVLNEDDKPFSKEQLQNALQSAECVLPTVTDPIGADVFAVPNIQCKFLGNFGVGFNHIDLDAAKAANIAVSNTPEVLTDCTADIAMTLLLSSARRTNEGERELRAGKWAGWRPTHMIGAKVTGKTLGLIGFGRIAQAVAHKAHFGFDMNIIYYNPVAVPADRSKHFSATACESIEELLEKSDFVSLHCPGGEKTKHLMNAERFKHMQKHAFLINTARGDVVDSKALIEALRTKQIAGAGLDVFEGEPKLDAGFLDLENAVLLPHLGSASSQTRVAMGMRVVENLRLYLDNKPLRDKVA